MKPFLSVTTFFLACAWGTQCLSAPDAPDACLDNQEQLRLLTSGLQALYEAGKTAPMETLARQLARAQCSVRLDEPPKAALTPPQIYEQKKNAVPVVGGLYKCKKCGKWHVSTASGFLVTASGIMLTNYHVIDATNKVAIGAMTYDGKVYVVKEILAASESDDIAVLRLDGSGFPCLRLAAGSRIGDPVWVISHPNKQFYSFTEGMVSGYALQARKGKPALRMSITADFGVGSSGAPVFDGSGAVVGMVAATQPVHAHEDGDHDYAQMVLKQCVPSSSILALFGGR